MTVFRHHVHAYGRQQISLEPRPKLGPLLDVGNWTAHTNAVNFRDGHYDKAEAALGSKVPSVSMDLPRPPEACARKAMPGNQTWIRPVVRARVGVCADNSGGDPLFAKGNI